MGKQHWMRTHPQRRAASALSHSHSACVCSAPLLRTAFALSLSLSLALTLLWLSLSPTRSPSVTVYYLAALEGLICTLRVLCVCLLANPPLSEINPLLVAPATAPVQLLRAVFIIIRLLLLCAHFLRAGCLPPSACRPSFYWVSRAFCYPIILR